MGTPDATPFPALLQMQVWDTAGQERFRTITQSYYRSAHAAIIAYDLTRRSTFESVPHWIHEIEKYGAANLVIMLIGMAFPKVGTLHFRPPLLMHGFLCVFLVAVGCDLIKSVNGGQDLRKRLAQRFPSDSLENRGLEGVNLVRIRIPGPHR